MFINGEIFNVGYEESNSFKRTSRDDVKDNYR